MSLGLVPLCASAVRFHETTPIGRFIPLNPRDGAEMAFPGVFWPTNLEGGRPYQRLRGMPTDRSSAHSTEVALTATRHSRIMAAVWLELKCRVRLTAEAW